MSRTPKDREDEVLLRMLKTPPKPHAEMTRKPKASRVASKPSSPKKSGGKV